MLDVVFSIPEEVLVKNYISVTVFIFKVDWRTHDSGYLLFIRDSPIF